MLAESNGYALVDARIIEGLICVCLRKDRDGRFMLDREKFLSAIALRGGGSTVYPGINDRAPRQNPVHRLARILTAWAR